MTRLSMERMQDLLARHSKFEQENDLDGIMSTLVAHPVFEFHPQKLRVEGRHAVREMYARICGKILMRFAANKQGSGATGDFSTATGGMMAFIPDDRGLFLPPNRSRLVIELEDDFRFDDGQIRRVRMCQFVDFEGDLMLGERTYTDSDLAAEFDRVLGPDFLTLPGVSPSSVLSGRR